MKSGKQTLLSRSSGPCLRYVSENYDEEHCFLKSFGFRFRLVMFFRGTSIFAMLAGGETIGTINCGQVVGEYSE